MSYNMLLSSADDKLLNELKQKAAKAEKRSDLASKYAKMIAKEYKKIDRKANREAIENELFDNILEALGDI